MIRLAVDSVTGFSAAPLRIATWLGGFAFLVCLGLMVYTLSAHAFQHTVPGWTSLFIGVLFIGAVQLVCVGLLGEYVGRIYTAVQNRPTYFIGHDTAARATTRRRGPDRGRRRRRERWTGAASGAVSRGAVDGLPGTPPPAGTRAEAGLVNLRRVGDRAFVLTGVGAVGTLRPCAWGVPWPSCVPSNRTGAVSMATAICALSASRRESAVFDTPDRVGRRRSRLASPFGTQKPEK